MKAFISHSSVDKPLARQIADEIRIRGHEVWLDERDLGPGQPLAAALSEALHTIDVFVILLTENSVASPWVSYELNQAIQLVVGSSTRILPLKFDTAPLPAALSGFIYADCSNTDGLNRALNLTFTSANLQLPLSKNEIDSRFKDRTLPEYCIRLIQSKNLGTTSKLGPSPRKYVAMGDYFEQCGRPLREILGNLFVGKYLDKLLEPDDEWSAIVIEVGKLYERKLDLLAGTWKSVYRILTDERRLKCCAPGKYHADLGDPPRNYWAGDRRTWYHRVREELQQHGYPKPKDEQYLQDAFGIIDMSFVGDGRGPSGSRIFFARNLSLSEIRHWIVDLGKPTESRVLN